MCYSKYSTNLEYSPFLLFIIALPTLPEKMTASDGILNNNFFLVSFFSIYKFIF